MWHSQTFTCGSGIISLPHYVILYPYPLNYLQLPYTRPGKRLHNYITNWKIAMLLMGKSTISMAIFKSYVCIPGP
jgi:hypothetical protein